MKSERGKKYGRWEVVGLPWRDHSRSQPRTYVKVKCECGTEKGIALSGLKGEESKSCGCLRKDTSTRHGMCLERIYRIWANMLSRCRNPRSTGYEHYGGRGIAVCSEWYEFEPFHAWAKQAGYSVHLTLDRKDTDGNYCSSNCRWVSRQVQSQNRRQTSSKSGFIGVHPKRGRWIAYANKGTRRYLGTFDTKEEAARARDRFVIDNFDASAPTNFPRFQYA